MSAFPGPSLGRDTFPEITKEYGIKPIAIHNAVNWSDLVDFVKERRRFGEEVLILPPRTGANRDGTPNGKYPVAIMPFNPR